MFLTQSPQKLFSQPHCILLMGIRKGWNDILKKTKAQSSLPLVGMINHLKPHGKVPYNKFLITSSLQFWFALFIRFEWVRAKANDFWLHNYSKSSIEIYEWHSKSIGIINLPIKRITLISITFFRSILLFYFTPSPFNSPQVFIFAYNLARAAVAGILAGSEPWSYKF